jgi:TolB-like protein/tetratricopeptide (TPR) repeat protein
LVRLGELIAELKRRRVFRALVGWGVFSFAVLQVFEPVMHGLHLPEWTLTLAVVVLAAGFPATILLAWVFDVGVGGIERTPPATTVSGEGTAPPRGPGLVALLVGIGLVAAAPGLAWYLGLRARPSQEPEESASRDASIAVLPFADMSPQRDQGYLADGISEEIMNVLAHVEGLHVAGRTSSFSFKGTSSGVEEIGRKLHVGNVLEGSVRKDGGRLRVTAQLISVRDGFHRWSETFDRELTGVFAIQDEIARAVADALRLRLLPGGGASGAGKRTASPDAHASYLLGRQHMARGTIDGFGQAVRAFERAVEIDPSYAAAWAGLADAVFWLTDGSSQTDQDESAGFARAMEAAERSVTLAPDLAEAHAARGFLRYTLQRDWEGAREDLGRAVALAPGNSDAMFRYAMLLASTGRWREAIDLLRRATEVDPLSANAWWRLGWLYVGNGQLEQGAEAASRALAIAPRQPHAGRTLGFARLLQGRNQEAMAAFVESDLFGWMGKAMVPCAEGRRAEGLRAIPGRSAGGKWPSYQVAEVQAWCGDLDEAFAWLDRAALHHDPGLAYASFDPFLDRVRADPRWNPLALRLGIVAQEGASPGAPPPPSAPGKGR